MANANETFFTIIGCMDGRCVDPVESYGRQRFGAHFADTITEPGIVDILTHNPSEEFMGHFMQKITISLEKHGSKGIIIDGHAECAGAPIPDEQQKDEVRQSIDIIRKLIGDRVPVVGVFVHRPEEGMDWVVDEVPPTVVA